MSDTLAKALIKLPAWYIMLFCYPMNILQKFVSFSMLQMDELAPFLPTQALVLLTWGFLAAQERSKPLLALFLPLVKGAHLSITWRWRVQQGISAVLVSLASPRESTELIVMQTNVSSLSCFRIFCFLSFWIIFLNIGKKSWDILANSLLNPKICPV